MWIVPSGMAMAIAMTRMGMLRRYCEALFLESLFVMKCTHLRDDVRVDWSGRLGRNARHEARGRWNRRRAAGLEQMGESAEDVFRT